MARGRLAAWRASGAAVLLSALLWGLWMLLAGRQPVGTAAQALNDALGSMEAIGWTMAWAAVLVLVGLSAALAFKAGLYNTGAEGQCLAGVLAAAWVARAVSMPGAWPGWLQTTAHTALAVVAGMAAATLLGGVVGVLKVRFGAHEALTGLLINGAVVCIFVAAVDAPVFAEAVEGPASLLLAGWRATEAGAQLTMDMPWLAPLGDVPLTVGMPLAVCAALWLSHTLKCTRWGLEIRAVGDQPLAARQAGIPVGLRRIQGMLGAGALAGLAGAVVALGLTPLSAGMLGVGYTALAVALLAHGSPWGCAVAGLFMGVLYQGGMGDAAAGLMAAGLAPGFTLQAPPVSLTVYVGLLLCCLALPKVLAWLPKRAAPKARAKDTPNA